MNLGAVLARRPAVALVDNFAHSNVPGLRHAKRWQDVENLLKAGIDVISTVCVWHLDSLSDLATKVTGVSPPETVPDPVVRAAGEVELVDVAPEALRDRMARGHIYPAEQAAAALDGWFQTGNLSVLREAALLWLADTLATDPERHQPRGGVPDDGHARERVVVALGGCPEGETLIRRSARIAARSGGDLLAVHAAPPGGPAAAHRAALAAQRQLTVSLGGSYHQLADQDIPAALLAFAHANNATQLVLGTTRHTSQAALRPASAISSRVIRRGGGIDVYIVHLPTYASGMAPAARDPHKSASKTRRTAMEQNTWPGRMRRAARRGRRRAALGGGRHLYRTGWLSAGVIAVALIVAACASSGSGGPGAGAAHHHHHARPVHAAGSTPPAPPATAPAQPPTTAPAQPANPIPQGNGGDHDADNNGGPSDGDGNI
jgi:K+-sensing histidine kinase KdpD